MAATSFFRSNQVSNPACSEIKSKGAMVLIPSLPFHQLALKNRWLSDSMNYPEHDARIEG
jgi:hypothetical protein